MKHEEHVRWSTVATACRRLSDNIDEFGAPTDSEFLEDVEGALEAAYGDGDERRFVCPVCGNGLAGPVPGCDRLQCCCCCEHHRRELTKRLGAQEATDEIGPPTVNKVRASWGFEPVPWGDAKLPAVRETGEQAAERIIPPSRDTGHGSMVTSGSVTINGANYGAEGVREEIANAINGAFVAGFAAGQAMPALLEANCTDEWHQDMGRSILDKCPACNTPVPLTEFRGRGVPT